MMYMRKTILDPNAFKLTQSYEVVKSTTTNGVHAGFTYHVPDFVTLRCCSSSDFTIRDPNVTVNRPQGSGPGDAKGVP